MEQTRFNALIHLLDDEDPEVFSQVERELYQLGPGAIERLEAAWEETPNPETQSRLEELIMRIQQDHFSTELLNWRRGGGESLLEGWMLLSQFRFPTLDVQKYHDGVKRLMHKTWLMFENGMNDLERLTVVNKQLYGVSKFNGNFDEPHRPENNFLSWLVDTGKGNSLSLSALYALIAQELQLPVQVVNFNGYYALRYYDGATHFYIDTYNKGLFFTPQQVQHFLSKLGQDDNVLHYKPLTNIYILLELIKNLIADYRNAGNESKAAAYEELLASIEITF